MHIAPAVIYNPLFIDGDSFTVMHKSGGILGELMVTGHIVMVTGCMVMVTGCTVMVTGWVAGWGADSLRPNEWMRIVTSIVTSRNARFARSARRARDLNRLTQWIHNSLYLSSSIAEH